MKYQNSRCRAYFVSLPPSVQCALHAQNEFVHSAQALRTLAAAAQRTLHYDSLGGWR